MTDAEAGDIAFMGARQHEPPILLTERCLHIRRPGKLCVVCGLASISAAGKGRGGGLLEGKRRMGRSGAGKHAPVVVVCRGRPAIDDNRMLTGAHLEGEAPGMGFRAQGGGWGGGGGVGDKKCGPALHTHITRIWR